MPRNLREALDQIQGMLDGKEFSGELWDILVALRGPDSRDRKVKYATTAIIRNAAFPKRPCEERSIFGKDNAEMVNRRKELFKDRKDHNHFREHVRDAFSSLGLKLFDTN